MMVSFVLSFFPRDVLDEILNLIESVSEDFLTTLTRHRTVVVYIVIFCFETLCDSFSFCTTKEINMFYHVFLPKGIHMLRNEMHHRGFIKIKSTIVGKYGTSSICSARMIGENLARF